MRPQSTVASQKGPGVVVIFYINIWLRWRPSKRGLGVDKTLRHAMRTYVMSISTAGILVVP